MIFGIYEQADLFRIAKCGRRATLMDWLHANSIPFSYNSKDEIIAHEKAVEAALGVDSSVRISSDPAPKLCLE